MYGIVNLWCEGVFRNYSQLLHVWIVLICINNQVIEAKCDVRLVFMMTELRYLSFVFWLNVMFIYEQSWLVQCHWSGINTMESSQRELRWCSGFPFERPYYRHIWTVRRGSALPRRLEYSKLCISGYHFHFRSQIIVSIVHSLANAQFCCSFCSAGCRLARCSRTCH